MHKQKRPFLHILSFYTKQSNLVVTLQYYNEVALFCFVHSALSMKELVFKIRAPWTYLTHTSSCQIIVSYLDSLLQNINKRPDPTYTHKGVSGSTVLSRSGAYFQPALSTPSFPHQPLSPSLQFEEEERHYMQGGSIDSVQIKCFEV